MFRTILLVASGLAVALPLVAQDRERVRVRSAEPQARVWINGEEVDPMQWVASRRARLGITVDMRASENDSIGATISSVTPGGPASKAGLRSGDIVTKLDGKSMVRGEREQVRRNRDDDEDLDDESLPALRLIETVSKLEPGDTVAVEYRRGRETRTASVVTSSERQLAARSFGDGNFVFTVPEIEGRVSMPRVRAPRLLAGPGGRSGFAFSFGGPLADLELAPMNENLGSYFGTNQGVLVIDAPAENSFGLKGGDVIMSVDGRQARGPSSLLRILQTYDDGDVVKLEIMRNKARQTISSKLDKREDE
ncbi:MAG: PDZ domain-containing protein [Gemmatimonadetes bacterium]|nr:PDZ domain-containing protein [Gemmatimonadota bacterium]